MSARKPSAAPAVIHPEWDRVIYVVGDGYDCDEENTGAAWSQFQRKATRRGVEEARQRRDQFRDAGSDARIIRLRPRATPAGREAVRRVR